MSAPDPSEAPLTVTLAMSAWSRVVTQLQRAPFIDVVDLINALVSQLAPQVDAAYQATRQAEGNEQATAPATNLEIH